MPPASSHPVKVWRAPDVMQALMLRGRFVGHRYPPHSHDTHCLAVITAGAIAIEAGGQRAVCRRGDIALIEAETLHSGQAADAQGWKMRVLHVLPEHFAEACEQAGLARRTGIAPKSPFVRDAELGSYLYGLNWCSEVQHDALKRGEVLVRALAALQARHGRRSAGVPRTTAEPALVQRVQQRLRDDLDAKLTLPALAAAFGVTPFVLLRAFVRECGISPHAYRQQLRVREAVGLLKRRRPPIEVAAETGFADQAHFTRVFKQHLGVTPRMFQQALQA